MAVISELLILLTLLCLAAGLIILASQKSISGHKIMLLGINITLLGGIFAVDPNSNLGGFEYLIVILGLIISVIGLLKKD